MNNHTDVILGTATGYSVEQVRLFVNSLAKVRFRGRLTLFVHRKQLHTFRDYFRACTPSLDIELVKIRSVHELPKLLRSCLELLSAVAPNDHVSSFKQHQLRYYGQPHVTRYLHYANYLSRHTDLARILLTDVRDVVFQDDPFDGLAAGLEVGMEAPDLTIATEPYDRSWILDAYGTTMLEKLGGMQVSCSGVTAGDFVSIQHYIALMIQEALRLPLEKMKTRIYDQAFHNKLLYCGELSEVQRCQPLQSRIATVGCLKPEDFMVSRTGQLLNVNGKAAPIVHQYDRHRMLVDAFESCICK